MNIRTSTGPLCAALALLTAQSTAHATSGAQLTTPVVFNVANIPSVGAFGDAGNFVTTLQLAPGAQVTGVTFDLNLSAASPSWLSEMFVMLSNSAVGVGYMLTPASALDRAGSAHVTGSLDLQASNAAFAVGNDGVLRLEFADAFDDAGVTPDGMWLSGSMTFNVTGVVPEPATYGLMACGLIAVGMAARRRRG